MVYFHILMAYAEPVTIVTGRVFYIPPFPFYCYSLRINCRDAILARNERCTGMPANLYLASSNRLTLRSLPNLSTQLWIRRRISSISLYLSTTQHQDYYMIFFISSPFTRIKIIKLIILSRIRTAALFVYTKNAHY